MVGVACDGVLVTINLLNWHINIHNEEESILEYFFVCDEEWVNEKKKQTERNPSKMWADYLIQVGRI